MLLSGSVRWGYRTQSKTEIGKVSPEYYFIPVRLEQCDVPDAIKGLHWIDLKSEEDLDQLFRSIEYE